MAFFIRFFVSLLLFISNCESLCQLRFRYSKVCRFYNYQSENCSPFDIELCEVIKTTYKEFRCPYYDCVSKFVLMTNPYSFVYK